MMQIAKLASSDFLSKDSNQDGQASRTEYIISEVNDTQYKLTPEEKAETAVMASLAFDAINSLVLVDSNPDNDEIDNFLSKEDMQNFYKVLDGYNFDDNVGEILFNGVFDGELDMDSFGTFLEETTATISDENKQKMYETFLGIFSK